MNRTLILILVVFASLALPLAVLTPLGNDEIYTLQIARQPGLAAICSAIVKADNHPPLDYWIRHGFLSLFGVRPVILRLPSLLAVMGALALFYRLLCRWMRLELAVSGVLLIVLSWGLDTSFFARPYGPSLFCVALALFAWDSIAGGSQRLSDRALLVLALAAGVHFQYFSAFYLGAFGAAAVVWSLWQKRVCWTPLVLVALSGLLVTPLLPLMKVVSKSRTIFWTPVTITAFLEFYPHLLGMALPAMVIIVIFVCLDGSLPKNAPETTWPHGMTMLALAGLAVLPVPEFVLAKLWTGAFWPRYILASGVALCIIAVLISARLPLSRWSNLAFIVVPVLFLGLAFARHLNSLSLHRLRVDFTSRLQKLQAGNTPVVLADDGLFVELSYVKTDAELVNTWYVYDADPKNRKMTDLHLAGLQQIMPFNAMPYEEFKARNHRFFYIGPWGEPVLRRAFADGASIHYEEDSTTGLGYWAVLLPLGR